MIRHLVMFTLTAAEDAQRAVDASAIRTRLTALVGVVPGLQSIAFEQDLGLINSHLHAVLLSEHDDRNALEDYQSHPGHLEAAAFIRTVTGPERAVVDYEV